MASLVPILFTNIPGRTTIHGVVTIGSTGAATLQTWNPTTQAYSTGPTGGVNGIASFSRASTGTYTITLDRKYPRILGMDIKVVNTTGVATVSNMSLKASAITALCNTSTLTLVCATGTTSGTITDPPSGDIFLVYVNVQDANAA